MKRDYKNKGESYRENCDWLEVLKWNLCDGSSGFLPGLVMLKVAFAEIAGALGAFIHRIVKSKENTIETKGIKLSSLTVRGDLVDLEYF